MPVDNRDKSKVEEFELDPELDNVDLDELEEEEKNGQPDDADQDDSGDDNDSDNGNDNADDQDEIDYKEKFANSSREAQVLMEQNKQLQKQLDEFAQPKEVTEEELKKEYPDWEDLTDFEKKLAKQNLEMRNELHSVKKHSSEYVNERRHKAAISKFLETNEALGDKGVPQLKGREEEFSEFAQKNSRKGLEPEVLAKIFLFENPEPTKSKKRGSLFNAGSGNGNQQKAKKNQGDKITAEEARKLRTTNQRKYQELARAGKLDHLIDE